MQGFVQQKIFVEFLENVLHVWIKTKSVQLKNHRRAIKSGLNEQKCDSAEAAKKSWKLNYFRLWKQFLIKLFFSAFPSMKFSQQSDCRNKNQINMRSIRLVIARRIFIFLSVWFIMKVFFFFIVVYLERNEIIKSKYLWIILRCPLRIKGSHLLINVCSWTFNWLHQQQPQTQNISSH